MSILLTTAYDPGDLDPGQTYDHADVHAMSWNVPDKRIHLSCVRGVLASGEVTPGKGRVIPVTIENVDPDTDYDDFVALLSNASEPSGDAMRRSCCQWLLDKNHFAGTLV